MAGLLPVESSHQAASDVGISRILPEKLEEGCCWYFSRKDIEEGSPSRRDNIDLKKEAYLRKSYCTFLQDLGMRLKVPQITIATAIIFCHRFFIRQSHAKNDRRTIATVCMFLAGKVEETPRPLKDVILVSYEIINKKDPAAAQRIRQREVYEQQKELTLTGERLVLSTLAFDLNVNHPYKPLVEAIKKFKVAQNALAQVAWNFVNDGLRTSLCLQFRPYHIAAGAIFLAAKFLKVKLPSDGERVWWQEFEVTPRQLEEVSNQMLELYEQNRVPPGGTQGSEVEGSSAGGAAASNRVHTRTTPAASEEHASRQITSHPEPEISHADNRMDSSRATQNQNNDNGSGGMGSVIDDQKVEIETKEDQHSEEISRKENTSEVTTRSTSSMERKAGEDQEKGSMAPVVHSPKEAIKMIDRDKVKAAIEKRKKLRKEVVKKKDLLDDDDLIERELEYGVELAVEDEKNKREKRSKSENHLDHSKEHGEIVDGTIKGHESETMENTEEEGEMLVVDDSTPVLNNRKRKAGSHDYGSEDYGSSYTDREQRRHAS